MNGKLTEIPVKSKHALLVADLPERLHKDPFDRLIVAQAKHGQMPSNRKAGLQVTRDGQKKASSWLAKKYWKQCEQCRAFAESPMSASLECMAIVIIIIRICKAFLLLLWRDELKLI
ncbi:PIN domain-containing protein [Mixta theicola]|uniref:hypothetical protein n=1 Tax=Mixta theicola TaxID=1458355 RepID=UPI00197F29A2|nr:hypothetical protein [Mixta theicola]GLR07750.1 hypothetical protein GCM10007905_04690 [Mixta theicola]